MDRTMRAGAGKEEIMLMEAYLAIEDFSIVHRALAVSYTHLTLPTICSV